MKRILVPTDFSEAANNALFYAAEFAKVTGSEIVMIHVRPQFNFIGLFDPFYEDDEFNFQDEHFSEQQLKQMQSRIEHEYGVECKYLIKHNHKGVVQTLEKRVDKSGFDLVIMSTTGDDNFSKSFLGSHAFRMAKKIITPVLIIPHICIYEKPANILYATDYEEEDVAVIKHINELLHPLDLNIKVVHISKLDTEMSRLVYKSIVRLMEVEMNGEKLTFEWIVNYQNIADELDAVMMNGSYNMLVLFTKRRPFIENIFHKRISKKLSVKSIYPVLPH